MVKPVELTNGKVFKSKKAAEQHFREMLARYNDGDHISDYQDHSDLSALLERFDLLVSDGPSKIGAGIRRFERRLNKGDGWSSPGFWVIRVDDTPTDFSYVQAVAGRPKSDAEEFSVAYGDSANAEFQCNADVEVVIDKVFPAYGLQVLIQHIDVGREIARCQKAGRAFDHFKCASYDTGRIDLTVTPLEVIQPLANNRRQGKALEPLQYR
ncbi:DCL family protein [Agrobacterium tumefaciens]|uniref:DCL family protein n=1 Tax=Agrobacterium tumefaciens TaxID=358 RepID=UPI00293517CE|nr:DCL family protein [Agrobacterium tumefaciens]